MQLFVPYRKQRPYRIYGISVLLFILILQYPSASGCPLPVQASHGDAIVVKKQVTSKKHKIKLTPDAKQEVLFFNAKGETGKWYQLFLFDMEGKLVKRANIQHNQTTIVQHLEKGNYLFEVFSEDERIENGQVIVQ